MPPTGPPLSAAHPDPSPLREPLPADRPDEGSPEVEGGPGGDGQGLPEPPGLRIVWSNQSEQLARVLGEVLRVAPIADPAVSELVLIGNRGMERWLSHQLAQALGVCAQVRFLFPEAALGDELRAALPADGDEEQRWRAGPLGWALAEALPAFLHARGHDPRVEPLRGALGGSALLGASPTVDRRGLRLCRELAQVIDRVVVFRPDEALRWTAGDGAGALIPWLPLLWTHLVEALGAGHAAARLQRALPRWASGEARPRARRLHVFGLSVLPVAWVAQLRAMSRHIPIYLYALAPSRAWWADQGARIRQIGPDRLRSADRDLELPALLDDPDEPLHPLLRSLGRLARQQQVVLTEAEGDGEGLEVDSVELFVDPVPPGARPTLLGWLQQDLLEARHPGALLAGRPAWSPADRSVQVHACHGLLRQVEVLHDLLLTAFAEEPTLEPRDVLVMCTDIEAAAPLVQAVFSSGGRPGEPPRVPFRVADLSVRRLNPVADVLLRLLELGLGRAPASALLDLLELEPLRRRFGLSEADLRHLEPLIQASGVRWGVDEDHRGQHGDQPVDPANTWRFGLERLLMGALAPDEGDLVLGVAPVDAVQGEDAERVGRLAAVVAAVFSAIDALRAPRPLGAWMAALRAHVDQLTEMDPEGAWLVRRVRAELDAVEAEGARGGLRAPIDADALLADLQGRFEVAAESTGLHEGAVTFCAMVPMRSVPYPLIAMIGLDDGALPRRSPRLGFDPTRLRPRAGDRSAQDEDRALFLEAVLSARSRLLLLTSGRDERSNRPRPPAAPLAELLDALDLTLPSPDSRPLREHLRVDHPLQPFDPANFLPEGPGRGGPFSHRDSLRRAAAAVVAGAGPPAPEPPAAPAPIEVVEIDDLVGFFEHPARALLQRGLGVQVPRPPQALQDREPIELDALERWSLADALLLAFRHPGGGDRGAAADRALERARAEGRLPLRRSGLESFADQRALAEAIADLAARFDGGRPVEVPVDLQVDGVGEHPVGGPPGAGAASVAVRVRGRLHLSEGAAGLPGLLLQRCAVGKEDAKRLLRLWIPQLVAGALGLPCRAVLVHGALVKRRPAPDLKGFSVWGDHDGQGEVALQHLRELLRLYRIGMGGPLPLFPRSSLAFAGPLVGALGVDALLAGPPADGDALRAVGGALGKAAAAYDAAAADFARLDVDDPYVQRLWALRDPLRAPDGAPWPVQLPFAEAALRLWGPALARRRTRQHILKGDEVLAW